MIKVMVCDGDGTLGLPNPSKDIRELLTALDQLDIQLAVASNALNRATVERRFSRAGIPIPMVIVTKAETGTNKPSPEFMHQVQVATGADLSEVVYLGDDDKTDTLCAINSRVLPFAARYSDSGKPMQYGIPVSSPHAFVDFLKSFAKQGPPYFGWSFDGACPDTATPIVVHALFGQHGDLGLTDLLKRFLKEQQDVRLGAKRSRLATVVFYYAVSQAYLSGLIQTIDIVAVYPGHRAGTLNQALASYSAALPNFVRQRNMPDLLQRHTDAADSRLTRGANRDIFDQFRTINVNPLYERAIRGRSVLVLDDFTTSGNSFETARRMLLQAGAANVAGLAVAKWGIQYNVAHVARDWDPFKPCDLTPGDVVVERVAGSLHPEADEYFRKSVWPIYGA